MLGTYLNCNVVYSPSEELEQIVVKMKKALKEGKTDWGVTVTASIEKRIHKTLSFAQSELARRATK